MYKVLLLFHTIVEQAYKDLRNTFDEDEIGELDPELFMRTNLGANKGSGKEGDRDKPKTQREIMMEIMEKSKVYREERRREAEELASKIDDVDAMMDDLQDLLHFRKVIEDHNIIITFFCYHFFLTYVMMMMNVMGRMRNRRLFQLSRVRKMSSLISWLHR